MRTGIFVSWHKKRIKLVSNTIMCVKWLAVTAGGRLVRYSFSNVGFSCSVQSIRSQNGHWGSYTLSSGGAVSGQEACGERKMTPGQIFLPVFR
jgi:hypothetical protein